MEFQTFDKFSKALSVKIPSCEQRGDSRIHFEIELSLAQKKNWQAEKTYPDFENLHTSLWKIVPDVPPLPQSQILKLSYQQIEQRRLDLEKYLKECIQRKDIMTSKVFRDFISLINEIPEKVETKLLCEFKEHDMPCIDVHYIPDKQVMFALLSKSNIEAKVKGFFSNILGSSSKGDDFGKLITYRSQLKNFEFQKLWEIKFQYPPSVMHYDPLLTLLAVGLENGNIQVLRIQTERNYSKYDEFCVVKKHTDKVTAIQFDHRTAAMFSIAKDKCLLVTDISQSDNHYKCDEFMFKNPVYAMNYDKSSKIIYVGCDKGIVHIFSTENRTLTKLGEVQPTQPINSNGFRGFFNSKSNYLLGGTQSGDIKVYELKKSGKEKFTNSISNIQLGSPIKSVSFDLALREIYCTYNNSILIIDSRSGSCIKSLQAHYEQCNRIQFIEDRKLLITCGNDQMIKIYKVRPGTGIDDKEEEPEIVEKPVTVKKEKEYEKELPSYEMKNEQLKEKSNEIMVVEESKFDNIQGAYQPKKKVQTNLFEIQKNSKQQYENDDDDIFGWDIQQKKTPQVNEKQQNKLRYNDDDDNERENDLGGWSQPF